MKNGLVCCSVVLVMAMMSCAPAQTQAQVRSSSGSAAAPAPAPTYSSPVPASAPAPRSTQSQSSQPRKVAVYVTGGKTPNENKMLSARITHALVSSGKYNTIERSDAFLDQVAKEMITQRSGAIDDNQISKLGQQAGADFVCIGEMLEGFGEYQISARIVNVVSVEVIASGLASGPLRTMTDFTVLSDQVAASLLGVDKAIAPVSGGTASNNQTAPSVSSAAQNIAAQAPAREVSQSKQSGGVVVNGASLAEKLLWLEENAVNNTEYRVEVINNESLSAPILSYPRRRNVTIRLKGIGGEKKLSLTGNGSLFTVESEVTLILDSGITLQGRDKNTASLVVVNGRGALIMNAGAKITGNKCYSVQVYSSYGSDGGGVYVNENGIFTMNGGEISGNTGGSYIGGGGGVYVKASGKFILTGGEITGNRGENNNSGGGGGVYVDDGGSFTMSGGGITSNTMPGDHRRNFNGGGGVLVKGRGTFTMTGGEIYGNSSGTEGGGVYASYATFTMTGGEIAGNTAANGGGVYMDHGTFTKTGGTIYGSAGASNDNRATGNGHAVRVRNFSLSRDGLNRNSTAGPRINLDASKQGAVGGWE